jgi:hypothetical protein
VANAAGAITSAAQEQADRLEEEAKAEARRVRAAERAAARAAEEQAQQAEEEAKAEARRIRAAERAEAKEAEAKAREPYEGLTKAELSERLAARDLPKTGNLDELVDRLVEADKAEKAETAETADMASRN